MEPRSRTPSARRWASSNAERKGARHDFGASAPPGMSLRIRAGGAMEMSLGQARRAQRATRRPRTHDEACRALEARRIADVLRRASSAHRAHRLRSWGGAWLAALAALAPGS